jgi:hypothetical protein
MKNSKHEERPPPELERYKESPEVSRPYNSPPENMLKDETSFEGFLFLFLT